MKEIVATSQPTMRTIMLTLTLLLIVAAPSFAQPENVGRRQNRMSQRVLREALHTRN